MMKEQNMNFRKEDYTAFIGKHAEKYLSTFEKFHVNGTDTFRLTWHWPAFFIPFWWMLYRKLYHWVWVVIVLLLIVIMTLILFGLMGGLLLLTTYFLRQNSGKAGEDLIFSNGRMVAPRP
jgi:hypothetical protein